MCRQSGRTGVDIVVYSSKRSAGSDSSRANWSIRMSPFEYTPCYNSTTTDAVSDTNRFGRIVVEYIRLCFVDEVSFQLLSRIE
jgi:hypothetical protein